MSDEPPVAAPDAAHGAAPDADPAAGPLELIAYPLHVEWAAPIVPAAAQRDWMVHTHKAFANRCLPLLMANQSGWLLLNIDPFRATWAGGESGAEIEVVSLREDGAPPAMVTTQFGYGVLTFRMPYLIRTPPGFNTLVRGPANLPRDGIAALEGLVETDWATQTFTMNWKFTRPGATVEFARGDPVCMLVPQRRGELERFRPRVALLDAGGETLHRTRTFLTMRERELGMRAAVKAMGGYTAQFDMPFARHYFEGRHSTDEPAPEHQKKRTLLPFAMPGHEEPDPDRSS